MTSTNTPVCIKSAMAPPSNIPSFFTFKNINIRTTVRDGKPWFAAIDVCAALEISNSRQAIKKLDDDEKGVISSDTLGGEQHIAAVNESGLYELIFRSRKPEAKAFKRWVKQAVLPAIRADGLYIQGEERIFAACTSVADVDATLVAAEAQANELVRAKLARIRSVHVEEREARAIALEAINRGRSRPRKKRPSPL
jgi:prophage antirepressor-like protein